MIPLEENSPWRPIACLHGQKHCRDKAIHVFNIIFFAAKGTCSEVKIHLTIEF